MALDKTQIPISINEGLDLKADPKQVQPGRFVTLENGVFLKSGQIQKVNGWAIKSPLSNSYNPSDTFRDVGSGISTLKSSLFVTGRRFAWSYNPSTQTTAKVGEYIPATVSRYNAINQDARSPSCVYNPTSNVLFYAWAETDYVFSLYPSRVKYTAIDRTTNSVIIPETFLDYGTNVKVITNASLDYYLIVYDQISTVAPTTQIGLYAYAIRKSDYTVSGKTNIDITTYYDYGFNGYCDNSLTNPYVIWPSGATSADTKVRSFGPAFASWNLLGSSLTISGVNCRNGSNIHRLGANVVFGMCDGTNVKTIAYNAALSTAQSSVLTVFTIESLTTDILSGVMFSFLNQNSGYLGVYTTEYSDDPDEMPFIKKAVISLTAIITSQSLLIRGCVIGGNAIRDLRNIDVSASIPGDYYLPVVAIQSYTDPASVDKISGIYTSYLLRLEDTVPFLGASPYVAAKYYDLNTKQPYSTVARQPFYVSYVDVGNFTYYGIIPETAGNASLCSITFDHSPVFAEIGNNLHVSGAYLGMFDGAEFAEHGFFQQPLQPLLAVAPIGSSLPAGTYYYQITYEWQDAYGQIHESAPSSPNSITITGNDIVVSCPTLKLSNRRSQVYIAIYRSSDGTTFYKVPNTGINSFFQNRESLPTIDFTDFYTPINDQPILYTSGGAVSNAAAPACLYITAYKRRLIAVPSEDPNTVWYSKEIVPATAGAVGVPVQFANEFLLSVDERGGIITGVIQLDDKLVIGKNTSISIVTGDGPAESGLQNDFTTPQLVATDTGVEPGRSMIIMPLGVMFKSPKGYYLLDRSLSVQYIGAPVENLNSEQCLSSVLLFDRNEVWFGTNTTQIIYNYYFNQWSTANFSYAHSCNYQNLLTGIWNQQSTYGSRITQETPGVYQRATVGYGMRLTTGWISFANLQGFQRVYKLLILGTFKSNHNFRVTISYDFDETPFQTTTWPVAQVVGTPLQYRIFTARQKCESIKFTLQDLSLSGVFLESYSLSNMAFEVGVKRGLNKLPAAQSVG